MYSLKKKEQDHKPRTLLFILEATIPPLVLASDRLIDWSNLFSKTNLIPGTTLVLLWLVAAAFIWAGKYRAK